MHVNSLKKIIMFGKHSCCSILPTTFTKGCHLAERVTCASDYDNTPSICKIIFQYTKRYHFVTCFRGSGNFGQTTNSLDDE